MVLCWVTSVDLLCNTLMSCITLFSALNTLGGFQGITCYVLISNMTKPKWCL